MAGSVASTKTKAEVLALVRTIPHGRVVTVDAIGQHLGVLPQHVAHLLSQLSEDEREITPWHRIVAKGGAIGRGAHRDTQFARLVREGVAVSPAGVVQDLARLCVTDFTEGPLRVGPRGGRGAQPTANVAGDGASWGLVDDAPQAAQPRSRSRGMRSRPG